MGAIWRHLSIVALEYYALILNRSYLVFVGDRTICGAYMGGPVMVQPFPREAWDPEYQGLRHPPRLALHRRRLRR